jgi:hypothetical protein
MLKRTSLALIAFLFLAACAAGTPHVIQTTAATEEIRLTIGMATQVEMPSQGRVQSVIVGDPAIVTADKEADVVNLVAKGHAGRHQLDYPHPR